MIVENINIGEGFPCFIIGEIGSNHNKDINIAYKLIDIAKDAGLDAIKFQTLKSNDITKNDVKANAYGKFDFTEGKNYWHEVLDDIVLPFEWHKDLFNYARKKGLIVFSTPESPEAVDLLEELEVGLYKIASMDINYKTLLIKVAKTKKPIILSSGIAGEKDIYEAINILKKHGTTEIALLHCVSEYPPKYDQMSLTMIRKYKEMFNIPVGLSNHSDNNTIDGVAIALGANIIEKHITLNKSSKGPDHNFALDPTLTYDLVNLIRNVEKALPINPKLDYIKKEKSKLYSRSIIVKNKKKKGDIIRAEDLDYKRPGTGISPLYSNQIIGLNLQRDVDQNHLISWEDFKVNE